MIDSIADLVALRDRVNDGTEPGGKYYKLTQNLNIAQYTEWVAIGSTESLAFTGHFDGNGKSIHVDISRYNSYGGLFDYVNTEVDTYAVKNLTVSGTISSRWATSIVVNLYSGNIDNCAFTGTLKRNSTHNDNDYTGYAGGIVALMTGGKITNCTVSATITGNDAYAAQDGGGVVAYMKGGSIENCKVEGTTLSTFNRVGGIVGYAKIANFDSIKNCTFVGTVNAARGNGYAGGIIGYLEGGNLQNNNVTADTNSKSEVRATSYAGGIAGRIGESTVIENCNISSNVTIIGASQAMGGIVALMNASTVKDNQNYGIVSGDITNKGGVVGRLDAASYTISGNKYSSKSAAYGIANNAQGVPSNEGCTKVSPADITITTASLSAGVRGKSYSVTLKSNPSGAKWSKSSGTLPTGLKLTSAGKLSGTPTKAGNFTFTVKATANGLSSTKKFTVKVTQTTVTATIPSTIVKGVSYTWTPKATGGTSAYKWSKSSGTLPTGMKINASTGKITGKPTKAGTFKFTIKAVDKNKIAGTKAFTVKVIAAKVDLESAISNIAIKGSAFSGYVLASNGTAPYTWSISSGKLPTGLKLTSSSTKATIKGTPTKTGTFTFTVKAVDKNKASATVKITVLVIDISSLAGTAGKSAQTAEPSSSKTTEQKSSSSKSSLQTAPLDLSTGSNTDVNIRATLSVASDDVVESYEGKDSDMVKVKADKPLTFIIGKWPEEVESVTVYVDDKAVDGVKVTEGVFTLPPELVHNDFKVSVKSGKQESEELFIIAE